MNSIDRDAALKVDCKKMLRQFDQMAQDLKTILHVQMEHKATKRKRGTELPAPEPKRRASFTPPRKARISVQVSQQHDSESKESDLEDDGGYGE
jgi:hypothetical protein